MLALVKTIAGSDEEAKKILEASKSEEVKKKLGEDTEWALKEEAFGLPWFVGEFRQRFRALMCYGIVDMPQQLM